MRIFLTCFAAGLIALGLWMIASGAQDTSPQPAPPAGTVMTAPPRSASPVILGTALLAGGVVFLVVILRR